MKVLNFEDSHTLCIIIFLKIIILTLKGTELVFQNSSHLQHWRLCCIYLGHRSLSVPQTWLLFRDGLLLLPTSLPGLEVPKRFVGLVQMSVFLLLTATGANKTTPLHVGNSYTHSIRFYSK